MTENPLERQAQSATEEMRRRMSIVQRAIPEKTVPVGKRQLSAEEVYMRDAFVPGFRQQAIGQASPEDAAKYYRMLVRGKRIFEGKHGVLPGL